MIISDELNDNPEQIKCGFKRKLVMQVAPNKEQRDKQKQEIADGSLALSYNGSPDGSFESLDALLAKYPNGAIVGEVGNEGYQRPKLIPSAEGVDNVYIYSRETTQWENRGEWNGWNTAIRIKVTTPIFSTETAEYIANYIKTNYYAIQDYKQLVVFVETETITTIYTGYITTFKGGTDKDYEFAIFGGYNERQSKYYYGDTTGGLTNDRTYYELDDTLKYKYDNYQTGVDKANNYLDNDTKQSLQDLKLDNHNDRLNNLEDIIHETIDTEVEEKFTGNKWNVPTSAEVDGKNYKVIDNQLFKISGIVGQTKKSINLYKIPEFSKNVAGVDVSVKDNIVTLNGTSTASTNIISITMDKPLPAGEYTIFARVIENPYEYEIDKVNFYFFNDTDLYGIYVLTDNTEKGKVINKTTTEPMTKFRMGFYDKSVFNNTKIELMLIKGTYSVDTIPPFEIPFEGLQSTTIKNITSVGKNRCTEVFEKGTILASTGDDYNQALRIRTPKDQAIKLEANTDYYIIYPNFFSGDFSGVLAYVFFYDENKKYIKYYDLYKLSNKVIASSPSVRYLRIVLALSKDSDKYEGGCAVFKGSNDLGYAPYMTDSIKTIKLTLKGAGNVGDEAILTRTLDTMGQPTELFEVDEITRMGEVDLSTLIWQPHPSISNIYEATLTDKKNGINNFISANYTLNPVLVSVMEEGDIRGEENGNKIIIKLASGNPTGKLVYELATPINKPKVKNLTLGDVSVLGQKGGEFKVNPIEPNIVEPKETRMKFDIKYWQEPTGGK